MIKVNRKYNEVILKYIDENNNVTHKVTNKQKDIFSANDTTNMIRRAISMGYGYAKCKAILFEGDTI